MAVGFWWVITYLLASRRIPWLHLLPGAVEVPAIETIYLQTPSPLNPLGAKGAGEVGTIPAAAAVISAIEDALQPFGVRISQTPVTPHRLVELIAAGVKS